MKLTKTLIASAIAAAAISSAAQAEVSTNIAVSSDYVWRGVTQTGNGAAVSGGIDYNHDSGFYAGTWISNTSFNSSETDLYFGYGGEAGEFSYSVGYLLYTYPSTSSSNFGEIVFDASVGLFSFGLAYTVNSDVAEPAPFTEGDLFYYVGLGSDLGNDWSLSGTLGYYEFDDSGDEGLDSDGDGVFGDDVSYGYVQVDLSKSYGDMGDITLSAIFAGDDVETYTGNGTANDPIAVISWSKGF